MEVRASDSASNVRFPSGNCRWHYNGQHFSDAGLTPKDRPSSPLLFSYLLLLSGVFKLGWVPGSACPIKPFCPMVFLVA